MIYYKYRYYEYNIYMSREYVYYIHSSGMLYYQIAIVKFFIAKSRQPDIVYLINV